MDRAVLRCYVTRWKRYMRAEVRRGRKGTGKLLAKLELPVTSMGNPLYLLAEQVAREHRLKVLVETEVWVDDNCCVLYDPVMDRCRHIETRYFYQ